MNMADEPDLDALKRGLLRGLKATPSPRQDTDREVVALIKRGGRRNGKKRKQRRD
jgi:hypothetical protein